MKRKLMKKAVLPSFAVGVAMMLGSSVALAVDDPYAPVTPGQVDYDEGIITGYGVGISVGGGFTNFTNNRVQDITELGGSWTARLTLGTRSPIAFEAAYVGTANDIASPGLDSSAMLLGSGVEGALRVNLAAGYPVTPFILAGVGWKRYTIVNDNFNTSDVRENDDVIEVPLAVGLAFHVQNFMMDARFDYRPTFNEDLVPGLPRDDLTDGLENWTVGARVGFEF